MNPQWLYFLYVPESRMLFNLDAQMFIDMIPNFLNFVLIAAGLTYLLYKPVRKILNARAERVESDMNDAATDKASAHELKAQYETKVREIETERAAILDEARKLANEQSAKIVEAAKSEAQDAKDRASRDIATEAQQVKGAVHQAIIDISTEMAEKLISATIDNKGHDKLFAEAMSELEATTAFAK